MQTFNYLTKYDNVNYDSPQFACKYVMSCKIFISTKPINYVSEKSMWCSNPFHTKYENPGAMNGSKK